MGGGGWGGGGVRCTNNPKCTLVTTSYLINSPKSGPVDPPQLDLELSCLLCM